MPAHQMYRIEAAATFAHHLIDYGVALARVHRCRFLKEQGQPSGCGIKPDEVRGKQNYAALGGEQSIEMLQARDGQRIEYGRLRAVPEQPPVDNRLREQVKMPL